MTNNSVKIKISKARVIDLGSALDKVTDAFIADGKIVSIGSKPDGFKADKTIKAEKQILTAGLVDLCARLREPGQEYKATIHSESIAAASSGITSLCCPPDTDPIIDTPAVAELIYQRAEASGHCRIHPVAAITHGLAGKSLSEMHALKEIGCVAVSNGYAAINNTELLRRALEYAYTCDMTVMLFCEDEYLRNNGTAHEGEISMRLGLPGIPSAAETIGISRALLLAEHSGAKVHFCRLSSAGSVELIKQAKSNGLAVTADVSIQHLHLTENNLEQFNSQCHLRPPLRTEEDRQALLQGIREGVIDAICSDHQPHDFDAKSAPFSLTEPGASSIELLLPLTMKLVDDKQLDLQVALNALSYNPASILGLTAGQLKVGADADLCIFAADQNWTIDKTRLLSAGKNTPYDGWQVKTKVSHSIMNGKIVYES